MTDPAGSPAYRGRFAPTPSGPLHLGSLVTALASFLQARQAGGRWLLRMDDLDRPRCPPSTDAIILRQLEDHGLYWDGPVRYQTAHRDEYRAALAGLEQLGLLYPCFCTRSMLRQTCLPGPDGPVYPGTCRAHAQAASRASLRLRVADHTLCFDDAGQGRQCRALAQDVGDFVVKRADGLLAYQLACAVDEQAMGITHVVRGADLLGSTFRQLQVLQSLGLAGPSYHHLPLLLNAQGRKLSKQNHAPAVRGEAASGNLAHGLTLLGQKPPPGLEAATAREILAWAIPHWDIGAVPAGAALPCGPGGRGHGVPL